MSVFDFEQLALDIGAIIDASSPPSLRPVPAGIITANAGADMPINKLSELALQVDDGFGCVAHVEVRDHGPKENSLSTVCSGQLEEATVAIHLVGHVDAVREQDDGYRVKSYASPMRCAAYVKHALTKGGNVPTAGLVSSRLIHEGTSQGRKIIVEGEPSIIEVVALFKAMIYVDADA